MKPDIRVNPKASENSPADTSPPPVQTAASATDLRVAEDPEVEAKAIAPFLGALKAAYPTPTERSVTDQKIMDELDTLDACYASAAEFDAKTQERWINEAFEPFTRRTEDPKLAWLEHQLSETGIMHLRRGESFHAPIMLVEKARLAEAQAILDQVFIHNGIPTRVEDLPDNDSIFYGFDVSGMDPGEFDMDEVKGKFQPFDDLGEEEGEGFDPARDGWVNKSTGRP